MIHAATLRIDLGAPVAAYRQVVDALRAQIVEGRLPSGHVLPPVRRLAMELGVHFNTIARAYRELANEGWLELKHGRRAVVIERARPSHKARERGHRAFRERLREFIAETRANGLPAIRIAAELRRLAERLEP
jgi:GntR family transcriptional regulator